MTLHEASKGQTALVQRIEGDAKTKRHLASLGLVAGREITILGQGANGSVILIGETRLAVNRGVAKTIFLG